MLCSSGISGSNQAIIHIPVYSWSFFCHCESAICDFVCDVSKRRIVMAENSSDSDNDGTSSLPLPGPRPPRRRLKRRYSGFRCMSGGCSNTAYDGFFIHHQAGAMPKEGTSFTTTQLAWVDFVGQMRPEFDRELARTYKRISLCSGHFREEDYESTQLKMYKHGLRSKPPQLEKDAIPTIYEAKQLFPPDWFVPLQVPTPMESLYILKKVLI